MSFPMNQQQVVVDQTDNNCPSSELQNMLAQGRLTYISERGLKDLVSELVGYSALPAGVVSHVLQDWWGR